MAVNVRSTIRDFGAAFRYLFQGRYPGADPTIFGPFDHDISNDVPLTVSSADDTTSVELARVDPDSNVRLDSTAMLGTRFPINFYLPASGNVITQTIFTNFTAYPLTVTDFLELHATAETASGTATMQLFKDSGNGTAPGGGSACMTNTINLKATANTLQTGTLNSPTGTGASNAALVLQPGERLSIVIGGTATLSAIANVTGTVWLSPGKKFVVANYIQPAGTTAATQYFFHAPRDYKILGAGFICSHAASGAPTITLDITQETGTTASGSGTTVLSAASNIANTRTINTPVTLTLTATAANLNLAAGSRLSIKSSGSWAGITGLNVVVFMQSFSRGVHIGEVDVNWSNLANGTVATAGFLIADRDYEALDSELVWGTASGVAGTIDITIDKGVTAPGGGSSILTTSTTSLNGTANTSNEVNPNAARKQRMMSRGDLLSVKIGSPSATAGVSATVALGDR